MDEKTREVTVTFSESTYRTLEDLARRTGRTVGEVLKDAIALEKLAEETRRKAAERRAQRGAGQATRPRR